MTTYPESPGTHMIVLPGGGYAAHAPREAEPVASWLSEIGMQASVFRYPLNVRHPAPLDALRAEIRRRRADGARRIGLIGFSAGGHLAGLAALAPGAAADQTVQFAVLGYAITSMETETYRPARLILLGEDAGPQPRRSTSLDALVTPESPPFFVWHTAEDPYVPPEHTYRFAASLAASRVSHAVHVFATARTASAWPRALARPRSGPRWRKPGSGNRRRHRDDLASRAHRPRIHRQGPRMYQPPPAEPPPGTRIATGPQIPVVREQLRGEQMSGSQQRADPKLCWNCGKRGVPGVGSRMTCPECEVTWMPWSSAARGDPEKVCWEGAVIFCVDFSRPGAFGAPA